MKVYIITIQSDGELAVLGAFRSKTTALNNFNIQKERYVGNGYTITEESSDEEIDLLSHFSFDAEGTSYDLDLWGLEIL